MGSVNDDGWLTAGTTDVDDVRTFYDEWAERYDADLAGWEYRAPGRVARLLAGHADLTAPILDAGCGTGLSGRALRSVGFVGDITGIDVSEASLTIAAGTGVYRDAIEADLNGPLPFGDGAFGAVACVGVLTYVPDVDACWREFCRVTRSGGVVAFTQREDTWIERDCQGALDRLTADGAWTPILVTDPEPYLPGTGDELAEIGAHYVAARVA